MKGDEFFLDEDDCLIDAAANAIPDADDAGEDWWVKDDYAWLVSLDAIQSTERTWRSFRAGYAAGGEVGRRRYAVKLRDAPAAHPFQRYHVTTV